MKLQEILKIAEETIQYVQSVLPNGSDNREEDKNSVFYEKAKYGMQKITQYMNDAYESNWHMGRLEELSERAYAAKRYQAGRCEECSAVAFYHLIEEKNFEPVSIILVRKNNKAHHALLLLGKPEDNNAVICDPHEKQAYPLINFYNSPDAMQLAAHKYGSELVQDVTYDKINKYIVHKPAIAIPKPFSSPPEYPPGLFSGQNKKELTYVPENKSNAYENKPF